VVVSRVIIFLIFSLTFSTLFTSAGFVVPEKNDTHAVHHHITVTVGDHIAMAEGDHVAMTGGDVSLGNHCSDSQSQAQNQHSGHALMMDCDVQCAAMSCISSSHFAQALNYHWPVTTHLLLGHQSSLQLQSSSETHYRPPITA
jgi:hypothetical protein